MTKQPFFAKNGDAFIPNPVANGPWDPNSMHGRVVIGLLAHVIEERHGSDEFVPARLTVDMFRLPDILTPVECTTRLIRDGKRIKVVEAEFFSGGTSMARASCQLLRKTENPQGQIWSPPNWDAPAPADIPPPADTRLGMS
ncbi:MAG: acyl-CoA thioesterase domain-containing protein, partial [Bradyrhizobium sp.]